MESLWNLVVHLFTGTSQPAGGLSHVSAAGGAAIDPNGGAQGAAPTSNSTSTTGDGGAAIDPNG